MASHHRIGPGFDQRRRGLPWPLRWSPIVLAAALLLGCADLNDPGSEPGAKSPVERSDAVPIIVNLNVAEAEGQDAAGQDSMGQDDQLAAVRDRVMDRLRELMPPEDFETVRTYDILPAIALSADGSLIAVILSLPEVHSIEADRELQPLGSESTLQ